MFFIFDIVCEKESFFLDIRPLQITFILSILGCILLSVAIKLNFYVYYSVPEIILVVKNEYYTIIGVLGFNTDRLRYIGC